MSSPLFNANTLSLLDTPGTLPQMSDALCNWFQNVTFTVISKVVVNFNLIETETPVSFQGVVQPFSAQELSLKPEGQRSWIWNTVHATPGLVLNPDDKIVYHGITYRVMSKIDYTSYGYVEFHIIQDFSGYSP